MITEKLWSDFSTSLRKHLESATNDALEEAWAAHPKRTAFYRSNLLPQVAKDLDLQITNEGLFKVDFTMWAKVDGHSVPRVFLESENAANTAGHEILKLCCLSAPLRVLISLSEWDDESDIWRSTRLQSAFTATLEIYHPSQQLNVAAIGTNRISNW